MTFKPKGQKPPHPVVNAIAWVLAGRRDKKAAAKPPPKPKK